MNGANGQSPGRKKLIRPHAGRMVAGVCAGISDYFGIDPNIVRLLLVLVTVFTFGGGALVYLAAWVVVPEEGETQSIMESYLSKKRAG
jgi:phage shock protein PspC (stress-responsive transcriptional regulator)